MEVEIARLRLSAHKMFRGSLQLSWDFTRAFHGLQVYHSNIPHFFQLTTSRYLQGLLLCGGTRLKPQLCPSCLPDLSPSGHPAYQQAPVPQGFPGADGDGDAGYSGRTAGQQRQTRHTRTFEKVRLRPGTDSRTGANCGGPGLIRKKLQLCGWVDRVHPGHEAGRSAERKHLALGSLRRERSKGGPTP